MTPLLHARLTLALAALSALACGRSKDSDGMAVAAQPERPGQIALAAGAPQLRYLKTALVSAGTESGLTAATGKVAFNEDRTSRPGSPLSGRVIEIHVKPGDKVRKGQPLFTLLSPEVQAALTDERTAEADLALASRSADRARRLFKDDAIPQKDVAQAESDEEKAKARVKQTQSRLQVLGLDDRQASSNYVIHSPIAGTVVERNLLPGMEVRSDAGQPLLTIADLSVLWVLADVYERDLPLVTNGQEAQIRVPSYPTDVFPGKVDHIGDVVDPVTRTVKIRVLVDNRDGKLKPEMFARVTLKLAGGSSTVSVPSEAVLTDGESSLVIVSPAEGNFEKRKVEVGNEQEGRVRILAGLKVGERVVTEGALFLKAEIDNR